jgi:UDP-glucose 4-epimerase
VTLAGKSVLVTGGAGFIGSHLVDRLAGEGVSHLVVVDNLFLGKESNLEAAEAAFPALRFYHQDASDFDAMAAIVAAAGVDVVFDLAVIPLPTSLERPRWTVSVNMATVTVACELLRHGAYSTLVHLSSSEVYGTAQYVPMDEDHPLVPLTPYAASKAGGDHVVLTYQRTFGVDALVVRPFNTFGPRQNEGAYAGIIPQIIRQVLSGERVCIYGDGSQTRDFTYVADVAEAIVRLYDIPAARGRVVNAASGREVAINDLVGMLIEALGADVTPEYRPERPGDVRRHAGSAALLEELTGWRPARPLGEALAGTVAWYAAHLPGTRGD